MGNISSGIRSIAERRAAVFCAVEKTVSEVTESTIDDAVSAAAACVQGDMPMDPEMTVDVDELMSIIPDQADDMHEKEIAAVLSSTKDVVGIDDIYGIEEDDEIRALV